MACIAMAISCSVAARLVDLQIVDNENHSSIAADELIDKERIPAQRGLITDRNDELLTNNIQSHSFRERIFVSACLRSYESVFAERRLCHPNGLLQK